MAKFSINNNKRFVNFPSKSKSGCKNEFLKYFQTHLKFIVTVFFTTPHFFRIITLFFLIVKR